MKPISRTLYNRVVNAALFLVVACAAGAEHWPEASRYFMAFSCGATCMALAVYFRRRADVHAGRGEPDIEVAEVAK